MAGLLTDYMLFIIFLTLSGLWIGYASGMLIESLAFCALVLTTNWELEAKQVGHQKCHLAFLAKVISQKQSAHWAVDVTAQVVL